MRIKSIGINMQNFTIDANTSIVDNNESYNGSVVKTKI